MHVALLLNRVSTSDSADVLDVLRQCSAVEDSLRNLGHTTERIACTLNLDEARRHLLSSGVSAVFNLVESLGGWTVAGPVQWLWLVAFYYAGHLERQTLRRTALAEYDPSSLFVSEFYSR